MLYGQGGREISARPTASVWPQPVQNSWSGGCGRPCNLPKGYASAPLAAASRSPHPTFRLHSAQPRMADCTIRVTHPPAYGEAEVQAPRQRSAQRMLHALGVLSATHAARVGWRSLPADARLAALSCAQLSVGGAVLKFRVSSTSTTRGVSARAVRIPGVIRTWSAERC